MLGAARRLRARTTTATSEQPRAVIREVLIETHDLMATAIVASIRRARDLADAIVARGGIGGGVSHRRAAPACTDAFVLVATTALCVVEPRGATSLTCNTFASAVPACKCPGSASAR